MDYSEYDDNTVHDMWVDYTNDIYTNQNITGENPSADDDSDDTDE